MGKVHVGTFLLFNRRYFESFGKQKKIKQFHFFIKFQKNFELKY